MLRKLIYAWRKRRFCKANRYNCPECIYRKFLWNEDFPVFRGVFCLYPRFKEGK